MARLGQVQNSSRLSCHGRGLRSRIEHMFAGSEVFGELTDDEMSSVLREASDAVDWAEAYRLVVAAEWDRRQAWANDGAYSGRCWLADRCTLSRGEAGALLRTARVVASAPAIAAAVADGSLRVAKAEVLASVVTAKTAAAFVRDEQTLLDAVGRLGVDDTRKVARWWQRLADQDGTEPAEFSPNLRCTTANDGTVHLAGVLDAEGGAIFRSMLEHIADQLWRAQRGDASTDARPAAHLSGQLRADAAVEMARRASAADPARSGARPLISVLIDLPTLEGRAGNPATIENGGVITAEAARRLACDAEIARVLTNPDGSILELGRTARTASPDQWRLLRLRDRGCTWPGCDRPPGWCQAHHIVWWEHDGQTDIENLTLLCSHHHHQIHDNGWILERLYDGGLKFTASDGRIIERPPPSSLWPMAPPKPVINPTDRAAIRGRLRALCASRTPGSIAARLQVDGESWAEELTAAT